MKKSLFLLTGLSAIFIWTSASAQVFKNDELTISSLGNKVWVIETYDNTTMYLVEGDEKALLIDTGTKCKKLDEIIRQITQKPLFVVLTQAYPGCSNACTYPRLHCFA